MKKLAYLVIGILFCIGMFKSGIASWFRIYEMFQFDSFSHVWNYRYNTYPRNTSLLFYQEKNIKDFSGHPIVFTPKEKSIPHYLIGGIIFGLGWALEGICPEPMFALVDAGFYPLLIAIVGALAGTSCYGLVKKWLPH